MKITIPSVIVKGKKLLVTDKVKATCYAIVLMTHNDNEQIERFEWKFSTRKEANKIFSLWEKEAVSICPIEKRIKEIPVRFIPLYKQNGWNISLLN